MTQRVRRQNRPVGMAGRLARGTALASLVCACNVTSGSHSGATRSSAFGMNENPSASAPSMVPPSEGATASAPAVGDIVLPLSVAGAHIVDARGVTVQLKGVNEGRLDLGSGSRSPDSCGERYAPLSSREFTSLAKAGFNIIRLAISWENLEPHRPGSAPNGTVTHSWNEDYLTVVDKAVEDAAAAHLMVVLDMHQSMTSPAFTDISKATGHVCEGEGFPIWLFPDSRHEDPTDGRCQLLNDTAVDGVPESPLEGMAAAWKELAARYESQPYVVGSDLINEPDPSGPCARLTLGLNALQDRLAAAVRSVNSRLLLFYEDNSNYLATHQNFLSKPTVANAVYEFHFYPKSYAAGASALTSFLNRGALWDVPVFLGEFNAFNGDSSNPSVDEAWAADTKRLIGVLTTAGASWALWEYSGTMSLTERSTGELRTDLLAALGLAG